MVNLIINDGWLLIDAAAKALRNSVAGCGGLVVDPATSGTGEVLSHRMIIPFETSIYLDSAFLKLKNLKVLWMVVDYLINS